MAGAVDQADGKSVKLSNNIMVSSWMGDPMVCIYSSWNIFFQVEFFEVNFRWNFAVNSFRCFCKISTWKKIPGGKICIFRLISLLYIAFHLYSISCEGEKNPPVFFLRFHVFKFTWIPAGPFHTGGCLMHQVIVQVGHSRIDLKVSF